MKLRQGVRYYLRDLSKAALIYYGVIAAVYLATFILVRIFLGEAANITNMETATTLFLFILGLNMFKGPFGLFLQNGLSRRTLHMSFLASAAILCAAMALIDSLLPVLSRFTPMQYTSTFGSMYLPRREAVGAISLLGMLWTFVAYFACMAGGFFITTLFYRMSKPLKLLVAIGVPVLLFIALPIVEVLVPSFNVFTSLLRFIAWAMGLGLGTAAYPWRAVASLAVLGILLSGLAHLLLRRATLKTA